MRGFFVCVLCESHMTTTSLPRTQVLVRGSHAWRITKLDDRHFEAINNRGVIHRYNNERDCDRFWDFLESVGFKLRQDGWTLSTLKHQEAAPAVPAPDTIAARRSRRAAADVMRAQCAQ